MTTKECAKVLCTCKKLLLAVAQFLPTKTRKSLLWGTCSMPCVSGAVLSAVQMSRDLILLAARGGGDCAVLILQMKKGAQRGWGTWPGPQRRLGPSFSSSGRSAGGRGAPPGPVGPGAITGQGDTGQSGDWCFRL